MLLLATNCDEMKGGSKTFGRKLFGGERGI
jgi:hypothetical protein